MSECIHKARCIAKAEVGVALMRVTANNVRQQLSEIGLDLELEEIEVKLKELKKKIRDQIEPF